MTILRKMVRNVSVCKHQISASFSGTGNLKRARVHPPQRCFVARGNSLNDQTIQLKMIFPYIHSLCRASVFSEEMDIFKLTNIRVFNFCMPHIQAMFLHGIKKVKWFFIWIISQFCVILLGPANQLQQQRERHVEQHPPPRPHRLVRRRQRRQQQQRPQLGQPAAAAAAPERPPQPHDRVPRPESPVQGLEVQLPLRGHRAESKRVRVVRADKVVHIHDQAERWDSIFQCVPSFLRRAFRAYKTCCNIRRINCTRRCHEWTRFEFSIIAYISAFRLLSQVVRQLPPLPGQLGCRRPGRPAPSKVNSGSPDCLHRCKTVSNRIWPQEEICDSILYVLQHGAKEMETSFRIMVEHSLTKHWNKVLTRKWKKTNTRSGSKR